MPGSPKYYNRRQARRLPRLLNEEKRLARNIKHAVSTKQQSLIPIWRQQLDRVREQIPACRKCLEELDA